MTLTVRRSSVIGEYNEVVIKLLLSNNFTTDFTDVTLVYDDKAHYLLMLICSTIDLGDVTFTI